MKILLVVNGNTGLQYHRQISPHVVLDNVFGDAVNITTTSNFDEYSNDKLKDVQIVHFMRTISDTGRTEEVVNRCHEYGAKVCFDIDDYWQLPSDHGLYKLSKERNIERSTKEAIQYADLVTTTTDYFQTIIGRGEVLPNCIDTTEDQWQVKDVDSNGFTRFGWIGGVWHKQDLSLIEDSVNYVYQDRTANNYKFMVGGYNDNPEYREVARILSGNGKGIHNNIFYAVRGVDAYNYGKIYNWLDISLIPLRDNRFNNCKSPLKLIEAGAMKKAAIVSNVKPYDIFPDDVVIKIDKADNRKGWYKAIKKLNESKQMQTDYANKLSEYCNVNFNAEEFAKKRYELYSNLIKG